jgi:hypothetical protein
VPANTTIVIAGTAADAGGGQVGGVEVSVDDGTSWRRAIGRTTWSYVWQTGAPGTATIRSRAVDDSGNLEQPLTSTTVEIGGAVGACPCSIWLPSQTATSGATQDDSAVELGTRFSPDNNGYITAIRFFKSAQDVGPHTGSLWSVDGARLATVAFTNQTASGWQEATLGNPVAVSAGATYVVSYHTASGFFIREDTYFSGRGVDNGPLHAPADTTTAPNGVFKYGGGGFPTATYNSANYWADVVFMASVGPDTTPPVVTSNTPQPGAISVAANTSATATFNEQMSAVTVSASTIELRDAATVLVPATVSYADGARTATLQPTASLAYSSTYTVTVKGGSSGVADLAGNPMAADLSWSFTTTGAPPPPPTTGPGGPILVIAAAGNPFGLYYAEILRAEGLNAFDVMDLANVTADVLGDHDLVVLGETPLTGTQVTMLSDWVINGGNLIAMRPDPQLASLLGLAGPASPIADGYLLVDTAVAPGRGIVGQTMQYHGPADRYTLIGATQVAALYTTSTAATTSPAVTVRSVGSAGGHAAAFAYDLARSVVYTRQGNPAWSGQDRDGLPGIRSDDLFFGGAEPNYVDLTKVAIPQADEQQRLLANLIGYVNAARRPLPRFWYLPRGLKAAVVMTGDDHANNGTTGRFEIYNNDSLPGCSVADWECVRATSYLFPNTPISASRVAALTAQGFEIGVHMWMSGLSTGSDASSMDCHDYTPASIAADYSKQIALFGSLFPSTLPLGTNRTHCIMWSDYSTQAEVALANGIRLDTNYYYWPDTWVNSMPGMFTGSGLPMRFATATGTMIDVYQAPSQMTDESGQSYPLTIDTLLDRALGPEGYYGAFVANMHTDNAVHAGSEAIITSAQTRGVPVISARQLLTWLDGRNGSSFGDIAWDGTNLTFSVSVAPGATGLETLLPTQVGAKTLTTLTRQGAAVAYSTQTIKGVAYATFASGAGLYQATYTVDNSPPTIADIVVTPGSQSAVVAWSTNEAATTRVDYGINAAALSGTVTAPGLSTVHSVQLTALSPSTAYFYRVTSADAGGASVTWPAPPDPPATFTTSAAPVLNCPCSIWAPSAAPIQPSVQDPNAVELGLKFRANTDGAITGVRFYKGTPNIGVHVGNLWSSTGTLLATVTFSSETASGWQQAIFATPVAILANRTYVVSYHAPSGFYAGDSGYFATGGVTNGPLTALGNGVDGPNGVYRYGPGGFPTSTSGSANYWVDVVFDTGGGVDIVPPTVTTTTPAGGATGVNAAAAITATFSEAVNPSTVTAANVELRTSTNAVLPAALSYDQPTRTLTLRPSAVLSTLATYTLRIRGGSTGIKDLVGNAMAADGSWTFTTGGTPEPSANILWTNSATTNTITAVSRTTGALIRQFNPGRGNGRGIVVVGNVVYYTVVESGSVYRLDATTGADLGIAFTVPGQTSLQQLAFDGANFWIPYGTNRVYQVTPNGVVLSTVTLSLCVSACDGLEFFNGKLISSRGNSQNPAIYDVYGIGGNLIQAGFIQHAQVGSGLAFDGTSFYVAGTQTISVYSGTTGAKVREMTPGGTTPAYEDLSFEYVTNIPVSSPTGGDIDGDGKADLAAYHPTNGTWHVLGSNTGYSTDNRLFWGYATDIPVPGDYDGDGRADVAIYRPGTGEWWVLTSGTNFTSYLVFGWGIRDDVPMPADYDGDGTTDPAIYRPSDGSWWVLLSGTNHSGYFTYQWGNGGDVPVPRDYDGDGKADLAIFRPSDGFWWVLQSSTGNTDYISYQWGIAGDSPVAADYDGDGKSDFAIYRPSTGFWWILQSSTNFSSYVTSHWGAAADIPVPADYDGDGRVDVAYYRPADGVWHIINSSTGVPVAH